MSGSSSGLLGILAGAGMTAVVGNYLVQKWQRRSWYDQQRQLIQQQELSELRKLLEDLTGLADARLFAMRSLVSSLGRRSSVGVDAEVCEYGKAVADWNKRLRTFYPLITIHYGYSTTIDLERRVHGNFVATGRKIERLVRSARGGKPVAAVELSNVQAELNTQGGRLSDFYRHLAEGIERRRREIIYGRRYRYVDSALDHFSSSDLIKALFTSDVDGFNIVRPA